jgi:hypothetical protein
LVSAALAVCGWHGAVVRRITAMVRADGTKRSVETRTGAPVLRSSS